ncbi:cell wall hydrolase, SleB [Desulforamulus reducens MI-1]|uniref:Cell wall hydrolase, SleB n=1 Tax=Desulforamulus reducens (strain ATCC BAA-1160 / DSM 100696 / MI-1) TaxID=349161 RepID=A4J6B6_DESRM|nr:cell wall hydrolase [Desulforamulus reducens]ABO50619.1 cell wall hydrolase, SleB [Desulforamulus reducens MI-1]
MNKKYRKIATLMAVLVAVTSSFMVATVATGAAGDGAGGLECEGSDPDRSSSEVYYTVQPGDTLYQVCRDYHVSLGSLMRANNLKNTTIYPDQRLVIPTVSISSYGMVLSRGDVSREDIKLLARLIHAEARGETFEGKVAVGAVILNRLVSPGFPKSIREIILENNNLVYQFSPVQDGSINLEPDEDSMKAALEALMGRDPTGGALFFYNPIVATDKWIKTLPVVTRIGNHVFATKATKI